MDFQPMSIDGIEAEVYQSDHDKQRHFVKITFVNTGLFINSFSVQPSKYGNKLWVQPPKYQRGKNWSPIVEFDRNYPLWGLIEQKAIEAVTLHTAQNKVSKKDIVYDDFDPDKPLDLSDIPL